MVWPLTGIAEVSYSLSFEHSEVSILHYSTIMNQIKRLVKHSPPPVFLLKALVSLLITATKYQSTRHYKPPYNASELSGIYLITEMVILLNI